MLRELDTFTFICARPNSVKSSFSISMLSVRENSGSFIKSASVFGDGGRYDILFSPAANAASKFVPARKSKFVADPLFKTSSPPSSAIKLLMIF